MDNAAASAAVDAFYETMTTLTDCRPGAYVREGAAGTRLIFTTLPVAQLNSVGVGPRRDLGEVDAFATELAAAGLPWSIHVRGEVDAELNDLATRHGRVAAGTEPLMVWDAESLPGLPAAIPDGATVRKVPGTEAEMYAAVLAAGFGVPEEVVRRFAVPAMFDGSGMTGFALDLHGEIVATGFNVIAGDYVGLYNGSVPPQHRGNGYYRALVTARLADAVAHGVRYAVAQNSPMSRPLYESVGFRLAETWSYLTSAE